MASTGDTSWKEHTSAFDRVQSVALSLSEPRTAAWIAREALVAENTARRHLQRLADLAVLTAESEGRVTTYYPDPVYIRTREVRSLVEENTRDELADLTVILQRDIAGWRDEYDAATPDQLRATATSEGVSAPEAQKRRHAASDWEHARYRLSLIEDALERYDEFTARPPRA